jgi:hypothetical protein
MVETVVIFGGALIVIWGVMLCASRRGTNAGNSTFDGGSAWGGDIGGEEGTACDGGGGGDCGGGDGGGGD